MAESKLKIDVRRRTILDKLRRDGRLSTSNLARELGTTFVTIRTDLAALENDGRLVRTRGGAILPGEKSQAQKPSDEDEKRRIAETVAGLVNDGATVIMNAGTTTARIAEALTGHKNLNILTNSLPVAMIAGAVPTFHVILLGGKINTHFGFTYGADVEEQLSRYHADMAILSIDGISAETGVATRLAEEAVVDRLMLEHSSRHMIAAVSSKVGRVGFINIRRDISAFSLVTDDKCSEDSKRKLEACGVKVVMC